jgi:hypothetical protein
MRAKRARVRERQRAYAQSTHCDARAHASVRGKQQRHLPLELVYARFVMCERQLQALEPALACVLHAHTHVRAVAQPRSRSTTRAEQTAHASWHGAERGHCQFCDGAVTLGVRERQLRAQRHQLVPADALAV